MTDSVLFEKIFGSLAGVAIGDALGFPTEGLTPEEIKHYYGFVDDFVAPIPEHPNAYLPKGHITDDTEETLLLADAIIRAKGDVSLSVFADCLLNWAKTEDLSQKTYIGPSTLGAIKSMIKGVPPEEAGNRHITCGAAMRIAPIGLIYPREPQKAAKVAASVSRVTHGGKAALAAASAVAAAISIALGDNITINDIVETAVENSKIGEKLGKDSVSPSVGKRISLAMEIAKKNKEEIAIREIYDIIGTGMTSAEAIPAAFGVFVVAKGDPMKSIVLASNIGGDTDTIAAISGAIAGAYKGIKHIDYEKLNFVEQVNKLNIEKIAGELFKVATGK
ncbi:MAG: ADP-ribosylglycohydrolase family protein [Candidatus Odinarchaeota archaeon]|nr:ADP-ribosylglycohydrolase family protein [Candidatus Odinarchaeota archaeon]